MPSFHHGAVEIAYLDEGEGDPIILVHGFASSKNVNWVYPTWVSDLKKSGRRVIAFDNRGHGESSKLYDAAEYEIAIMASDIAALMDHLKLDRADVMGYSLGSRMTAMLARSQPHLFRSAILGGIGIGLIEGGGPGENVAKALEADSLDEVTDSVGRTFRAFADQTRSDRKALAACLRGSRRLMAKEEAAEIAVPVLIATVCLAMLGNAVICGVISGPHDRYGSRLVWITTLAATIAWMKRPRREPEHSGTA